MCLSGLANLRHYLCDNAKSDSIAALSRGGSNARLRFYALDGFAPAEDQGWGMSYNFGSREAVILRWKAAIFAGVNFIPTNQYEAFAPYLKQDAKELRPSAPASSGR